MDLITILDRIEIDFFHRLEKNAYWSKDEIKTVFHSALINVLVTTYSRVMKDAREAKDGS